MSALTITRVNQLPSVLGANTIYIVKADAADIVQMYFTNSDGSEVRHLLGLDEVYSIVNRSIKDQTRFFMVADLTEMVGLALEYSAMIFVRDTSTQTTPNSGPGWYVFDFAAKSFTRMNFGSGVSSWEDLQNKPTSTVEQIDSAVGMAHEHSNKGVLDRFGVGQDGVVRCDDKPIVLFTGMEW